MSSRQQPHSDVHTNPPSAPNGSRQRYARSDIARQPASTPLQC
jgi:hypothetical protein